MIAPAFTERKPADYRIDHQHGKQCQPEGQIYRCKFMARRNDGRQEEDGFILGSRMGMSGMERMRVHNDHSVHHVRVGEQRNTAPV